MRGTEKRSCQGTRNLATRIVLCLLDMVQILSLDRSYWQVGNSENLCGPGGQSVLEKISYPSARLSKLSFSFPFNFGLLNKGAFIDKK